VSLPEFPKRCSIECSEATHLVLDRADGEYVRVADALAWGRDLIEEALRRIYDDSEDHHQVSALLSELRAQREEAT